MSASFTIPRTVHLAAQVLPAAGAYTAQDFAELPAGTRELTYWITYTRGAAGGAPAVQVQWGNGTEEATELILDEATFAATDPVGEVNVYLQRILAPITADANPLTYCLVLLVPYGSTEARLLVAEVGDVANPGTVAVAYTGGTGSAS